MDYQVDLETFRGPLDLLLYLVKHQEVDICDIPIAKITDQFLEYLRLLQSIDVDRAGDFLVMAATLMEIKSRMLLPAGPEAAEGEADPRTELVRQLVEYKKFKDAAVQLELLAESQACRMPRQRFETPTAVAPSDQPLKEVELWDLVSAFGRLMRETQALEPQQIIVDQTPTHVYMEDTLARLMSESTIAFSSLFTPPYQRSRLIGLFLAILELIRLRKLYIEQADPFGEIELRLAP
jgi:segregation and condensation protein A